MKRFKKIILWILIILTPIIIGVSIITPRIIESKIHQKAQFYGFNIKIDTIDIEINRITINQVSISSTFFPEQKAFFQKIIVEINWFTPENISIDGGNIELNNSLDTLKFQFNNWNNRNKKRSDSNVKFNLLDKISIKDISLIWNNWQPDSKLEAHGITLKDKIITINSVNAKINNRLVDINKIKYDLSKPIELYLKTIQISPIKSNIRSRSKKIDPKIPKIPKIPRPIKIYIDKCLITHNGLIIQIKQIIVNTIHKNLIGINLTANQIDINEVYLNEINATLVLNIQENQTEIGIDASASILKFVHAVLLDHEIRIKRPAINLQTVIGPRQLELRNGYIKIDKVHFNISGLYDLNWIRGQVHMSKINCQDLLDSIPLAMKSTIDGMKLDGDISWEIQNDIDILNTSNTSIRIKLNNDCKVISVPNKISIAKLRKPFKRYIYNSNNKLIKTESGPGTLGWTPISLTSMFIPIAIQTMEDPNFMAHRGFDIQAIENSIRDNIRKKKFEKGASTISMQLAKNLWLNRDKTISRKIQEAFLTIYLEQELRKDEIMELYMNIVEFGPNLYGIGKASQHYFNKHSSNLSLAQSVFLISILPKPKNFHFDANGILVPGKLKFLHRTMKAMRDKKIISEDEYQKGISETIIFGRASTDAETKEENLINEEENGISPDSWSTN